jgi:hypothetical protein
MPEISNIIINFAKIYNQLNILVVVLSHFVKRGPERQAKAKRGIAPLPTKMPTENLKGKHLFPNIEWRDI